MLANRLQKRFRHLKKRARRSGYNSFRLYDRDIPEVPLALEVYGLCSSGAGSPFVSGALYKRPYEKSESEEEQWLSVMKSAIATALETPLERIFLKTRLRQRGAFQYTKTGNSCVSVIAEEGAALRFIVNLSDYVDTGLFLDARKVRAFVRENASGKRILNLFCYTGSFSAAAAAGGASSVDSVDLSSTYIEWAKKNFALNQFTSGQYNFIRAPVQDFINSARAARKKWDFIVLDPPVFSNSKKLKTFFDLKRDYKTLVDKCLSLLSKDGILLFGVKAKGIDTSIFSNVKDITKMVTDEDFRAKKTGKWYVLKK